MNSALDYLFKSENAGDVVTFLRKRGPRAHIIAPSRVRERVLADQTTTRRGHAATWSEDLKDCTRSELEQVNFIVVSEDHEKEQAFLDQLRGKGTRAYGLFSHVLPALLCSANGMAHGHPTEDLKRYAILCVPRSGSRYLSAVLSNRGVGVPREHIREPLAQVIAKGNLGFGQAFEALEKFGQKNGIFGTKLISTFLIQASHRRMPEMMSNIAWMSERGYRLVHLVRPLNDTVISSYIAFLMRQWHFFGEMDVAARAKLDSLTFEGGAAWDEFVRFRAEKVIIDAIARSFNMPSFQYAEIESDVSNIVLTLCHYIDVNPEKLRSGSTPVPLATRTASPTYQVFAERLEELLQNKASEIEPATIKRVLSMTALSRTEAEAVVAEGE